MPSLIRGKGRNWTIVGGGAKRKWTSTRTPLFCEALESFQHHKEMERNRRRCTLSSLREQLRPYLEANLATSTVRLYCDAVDRCIAIIRDKPVREITARDVEEFKARRLKEVSAVRVNLEFRTLKALFNHGIRLGLLEGNVFALCKPLRVPAKDPVYISKEEYKILRGVIDDEEFKLLVDIAVLTGMRRGEIINLTWKDIDLSKQWIRIRNTEHFTVKTKKPRTVPIHCLLLDRLEARRRADGLVFTNATMERLVAGSVSRKFKQYCRKAGLPEEIRFHSLRHSYASWLVEDSVPLYDIQRLLGHSSPIVTQNYAHASDDKLRTSVQMMRPGEWTYALLGYR